MSKLASALALSTTAYIVKTFRTLGLREFSVEGREILLDALREVPPGRIAGPGERDGYGYGREEGSGKGKERAEGSTAEMGLPGKRPVGRRGIVTVCNHNSVFDDPLMWSFVPTTSFLPFASPTHTSRNSRWTLGASDIMFTNPVFSRFFSAGQVIETTRGGGVFQPAIDRAVKLLQEGEWIHIFPEGKVNQHKMNPPGGLFRFKWGVGRIIMDSEVMPEIIPMWISGFDTIMDEYRGFPRPVPRPGGRVSITFGEPITAQVAPLVRRWRELARGEKGDVGVGGEWRGAGRGGGEGRSLSPFLTPSLDSSASASAPVAPDSDNGSGSPAAGVGAGVGEGEGEGEDGRQRAVRGSGTLAGGREEAVRMEITALIQEQVRKLGERVESKEGRFERGAWSHSCRAASSAGLDG